MNLKELYEQILTFLERLILLFTTWYASSYYEKSKTSLKTSQKLTEAIEEKNTIKEKIKGMSREEKIKIAVRD